MAGPHEYYCCQLGVGSNFEKIFGARSWGVLIRNLRNLEFIVRIISSYWINH